MSVSSPSTAEKTHADEVPDDTTAWVLTACSSWLPGARYPVLSKAGNDIVKIGRADHCDINLPGTHLAREHVELRVEPTHIYVKDKGSVTGTYINDARVTEGIVRAGDKLRLDIYSFLVEAPKTALARQPEFAREGVASPDDDKPFVGESPEALESLDGTDSPERIKPWLGTISPLDELDEPQVKPRSDLTSLYLFTGGLLTAVAGLAAYLLLS